MRYILLHLASLPSQYEPTRYINLRIIDDRLNIRDAIAPLLHQIALLDRLLLLKELIVSIDFCLVSRVMTSNLAWCGGLIVYEDTAVLGVHGAALVHDVPPVTVLGVVVEVGVVISAYAGLGVELLLLEDAGLVGGGELLDVGLLLNFGVLFLL